MKTETDLIDYLGIYRARTVPRKGQPFHYSVSSKAAQELDHWPALDAIEGATATPPTRSKSSAKTLPERLREPLLHGVTSNIHGVSHG